MFPDRYCAESENNAHYYVGIVESVLRCKYCFAVLWQPKGFNEALLLGNAINRQGLQQAYQQFLDKHPRARDAVALLEDLRKIRSKLDADSIDAIVLNIAKRFKVEDTDKRVGRDYRIVYKPQGNREAWK